MELEQKQESSDRENQKDKENNKQALGIVTCASYAYFKIWAEVMDKSEINNAHIEELMRALHMIGDQISEMEEYLKIIEISNVGKIKNDFIQLDKVELNIAVTGESGSGKSTLINAFRGLGDEDEGAAETGVVETTTKPTVYLHPKFPNVKLWDLPGIGTPRFRADEYLKQVDFERYDFFIILASDRFRECHASLAAEIINMKKKFYFVRSRIDNNIEAEKRKKKFNKETMLQRIRENCIKGLEQIGLTSPAVYLISCFDLNHYDFNCLVETMETDLSQHKRDWLTLALPNISLEISERKKKVLQKDLWKIALHSALIPEETIPVFNATTSISVSVNVLVQALKKYYCALSWDPDSLLKLSEISGKSVDELQAVLKSPLHQKITKDFVNKLLINSSPIQTWMSFIPVWGSLTVSFFVVYNTLKCCLTELADDAHNVLIVVLQSSV